MTPDLDKYLERLVADADSYILTKPIYGTPSETRLVAAAYGSIITAICAVLREKREAPSKTTQDFTRERSEASNDN